MKTLLLVIAFSIGICLPTHADPLFPMSYDSLVQIYGKPAASSSGSRAIGGGDAGTVVSAKLSYNGVGILLNGGAASEQVKTIQFTRDESFNELEIADLIKPLATEDWAKKDDHTWIVPNEKAQAVWDGKGKVVVSGL